MKAATEAEDLHLVVGLAEPIKIRHVRHRATQKTERPAIAFRLVNIELDEARQQVHTQDEVCWAMTVDIIVDLELAPEADSGGDDPTGWNQLAALANLTSNIFLQASGALSIGVDDILPGDTDPDEDSTPDEGRLAQGIIVLYRTLRSDLNLLLT